MRKAMTMGLIGLGSIGLDLLRWLEPEIRSGRLIPSAALVRDQQSATDRLERSGWRQGPVPTTDIDAVISSSDVVVECAGSEAASRYSGRVIAGGRTLVLASLGVLVNHELALALESGPGRLVLTSGAIGGLDALRAAAQAGGLDDVEISTTKAPTSLLRPWMDTAERGRLEALRSDDNPVVLLESDPAKAIELFPSNMNVAVALAAATRQRDEGGVLEPIATALARVRVRLVADASATASTHRITARGPEGDFCFELALKPSPENPRSSALTAASLARDVRELLDRES